MRYRHALVVLAELLDTTGHERLRGIVEAALRGDRWCETHVAVAVSAMIARLAESDKLRGHAMRDTPVTPQGTPQ
jgi:hypothetical protein